ncbi:MAG: hypothetical protein HRU35_07710 [Rickettsiaceae bacterium]|nr:hypothetical protein [Rickettsiaceae bacterium]
MSKKNYLENFYVSNGNQKDIGYNRSGWNSKLKTFVDKEIIPVVNFEFKTQTDCDIARLQLKKLYESNNLSSEFQSLMSQNVLVQKGKVLSITPSNPSDKFDINDSNNQGAYFSSNDNSIGMTLSSNQSLNSKCFELFKEWGMIYNDNTVYTYQTAIYFKPKHWNFNLQEKVTIHNSNFYISKVNNHNVKNKDKDDGKEKDLKDYKNNKNSDNDDQQVSLESISLLKPAKTFIDTINVLLSLQMDKNFINERLIKALQKFTNDTQKEMYFYDYGSLQK